MVESLAKKIGLSIANSSSASTQNSHACSEHTKELVDAFYNRDDVSWQASGRKDRIIVREINSDGEKIKRTEQIRCLLMSLKETHNKYIESNPDAQIGLSKFCELRPKRVKLFDHIPHYVCVCSYHENVRLLLYALHQHTQLPVEFHSVIDQVTCNSSEKKCMSSLCENCKDKIDIYLPKNPMDTLKYQQWHNSEKVDIIGTVNDAFTELKNQLKEFFYSYIYQTQAGWVYV